MAAAFRPVNHGAALSMTMDQPTKPTIVTSAAEIPRSHPSPLDDSITPTRATFNRGQADAARNNTAGALASQKPLPTSPFPDAVQVPEPSEKSSPPLGKASNHSLKSRDSEDVEMNDSDPDDVVAADDPASDEDSVNADGTKPKNKKKSQRFYCTEYPPCNLSFTRSEHLARHIRKHTGERPFQCHCSRRFSRLDNLRQHAQTVHVNEDIPIDSLAASNTRFARQVRQERVRSSARSRTSTVSAAGAPVRGHSKSLSTSSIASIGSLAASYSNAPRDDASRRRPPPLVVVDPRSRVPVDSYRGPVDNAQPVYRAPSPSDFSTPTSASFSTGQNSPWWGPGAASSPTSSGHTRAHSAYVPGSHTPGRRLSVPSGNPFQSPHGALGGIGRPMFAPGAINSSSHPGVYSPSGTSYISSPTLSPVGGMSRRESVSSAADQEWRRKTWHSDSREYTVGGSRLSNVVTYSDTLRTEPRAPPIVIASTSAVIHGAANGGGSGGQASNVRLPGIESFYRPETDGRHVESRPPPRLPSPMLIDSDHNGPPPLLLPSTEPRAEAQRPAQWDMSLHRGLTRLEITSNNSPRDSAGAWASEANRAVQAQAEYVRELPRIQPSVRFDTEARVVSIPPISPAGPPPARNNGFFRGHHHTMSAPSTSSRDSKRHGWYNGPSTIQSGISEGVEPREHRGPHVDRMMHPNLTQFTGFPARERPVELAPTPFTSNQVAPADRDTRPNDMRSQGQQQSEGLDPFQTLVAAATGRVPTATAF